jgi:hypothetical protein
MPSPHGTAEREELPMPDIERAKDLAAKINARAAELVLGMERSLIAGGFKDKHMRSIMLGAVGQRMMIRSAELEAEAPDA